MRQRSQQVVPTSDEKVGTTDFQDLTPEEAAAIRSLHRLSRKWPKSLMLYAGGTGLDVRKPEHGAFPGSETVVAIIIGYPGRRRRWRRCGMSTLTPGTKPTVSSNYLALARQWMSEVSDCSLQERLAVGCFAQWLDERRPTNETNSCAADASRFRWLTADIADRHERERQREILRRMPVMSYSAACAEIDREMLEFCPDDMSAEQMAEWVAHQRPSEKASEGQS